MLIKIGAVDALSAENSGVIPDDRQSIIETIGGVVVQDFGHIEEGDKFTYTVTFRPEDATIIRNYWHNRTRVNVVDECGNVLENMRVVVKRYKYEPNFKNYYRAELELWKV